MYMYVMVVLLEEQAGVAYVLSLLSTDHSELYACMYVSISLFTNRDFHVESVGDELFNLV